MRFFLIKPSVDRLIRLTGAAALKSEGSNGAELGAELGGEDSGGANDVFFCVTRTPTSGCYYVWLITVIDADSRGC